MAPNDLVVCALGCPRSRVRRAAFPRTQSDLFARFPLLWVPGMPIEVIGYCARNWGSAQSPSLACFPAREGANFFELSSEKSLSMCIRLRLIDL